MKKKIISFTLALSMCLSLSIPAFATQVDALSNAKDANSVVVTGDAVYDFRILPEKSYSPEAIEGVSIRADNPRPYFHAVSELKTGVFNYYAKSYSESTYDSDRSRFLAIDYIMAKAKLYQSDALFSSNTDEQTHASYAGISTDVPGSSKNFLELYGAHAFEQQGYVSYYPETYQKGK